VIEIFEPPGGYSEDWYGVVHGKDGPAVVYPDYGQMIGATKKGCKNQSFKSKQAAVAFCARALRIPPEEVRTKTATKPYAYDSTTADAAPDRSRVAVERNSAASISMALLPTPMAEGTPMSVDDDHTNPYFGEGGYF
jgi:hypothetical protein